MAQIILPTGAVPATPTAGNVTVYAKTDGFIYGKDSAGVETPLSAVATASAITNTPAGNIAATTVQAAINELDSEKSPAAGSTSIVTTGAVTGTSFNSMTGLASVAPVAPAVTAVVGVSTLTARQDHVHPTNFTVTATDIKMDGVQAVGTLVTFPRADHVHPTDTSRAATSGTLAQFAATTSAQLAGVISDETGSGALVFGTSPSLTTPVLGAATASSINKVTLTAPATASTLTIADGKTFTASNTLTLSGTDASTLNIGTGGTLGTAAYTDSTAYAPAAGSTSIVTTGALNAGSITSGFGSIDIGTDSLTAGSGTFSGKLGVGGASSSSDQSSWIDFAAWGALGILGGNSVTSYVGNAYPSGAVWKNKNGTYGSTKIDCDPGVGTVKIGFAPAVAANASATFTDAASFSSTGLTVTGTVTPEADNTRTLGTGALRWSEVYAGTGTINTSDAREKTAVRQLTSAEISASKQISQAIGVYQWLSSIAEKGTAAREHIGLTVQRAIEIMSANSLDPMNYGFICYDAWEDEFVEHPEVLAHDATYDAEGVELTPAIEYKAAWTETTRTAGDRYSFRMDELNLFIARGFEARLAALEAP